MRILVLPNPYLEAPQYRISRLKADEVRELADAPSFSLIEEPKLEIATHDNQTEKETVAPTQFATANMPKRATGEQTGFIRRLWESLFGSSTSSKPKTTRQTTSRSNTHPKASTEGGERRPHRHHNQNRNRSNNRSAAAADSPAGAPRNNRPRQGNNSRRRSGNNPNRGYRGGDRHNAGGENNRGAETNASANAPDSRPSGDSAANE